MAPKTPRLPTRVWREAPNDFRYEVTHPDGSTASGAYFKTAAAANKAAATVEFTDPPDE